MSATASYTYDPNIGLPIDSLRGGITLVDGAVHVKVWKDSETGQVTVCIVPMCGTLNRIQTLQISNYGGGTYPGQYITINPKDVPPGKYRNGHAIHGHDWQHPAVEDRRPSNWCNICKDWFVPDYFTRQGV